MLKEFKEFAVKGNVMDLAVGVIIGAAFGKIVTSLVEDVIMPPIGAITGKINFVDKFVSLDGQSYPTLKAAKDASAPVIGYGAFINNIIYFLIVALAVFFIVQAVNRIRRQEAAAPSVAPAPTREEELLTEIRDTLRARA